MEIRSKDKKINLDNNPWAGLVSYEDPKTAKRKLKFCGRDDDSYDLARLIRGNIFVTLYGKSGIGKTSLLNAGVFPELRKKQFSPVSIRLGIRDEEKPMSYQAMVIKAVERVVKRTETTNVISEQQDQQSINYLWNYFARHRFYDSFDTPTTPVIVLDQFEEVFRDHRDEAETLLRQLDYLNDNDHTLDNCEIDGHRYHYVQNYRFIVSIREDDLYRLEDSIDNCFLPALKRCRYRLRGLSDKGAKEVICIGEGLFSPLDKDSITKAIISKSRNEDGSISTNILSLLCSRIYDDYNKSSAASISLSLIKSFINSNPFERFYNEATQGLSKKEKSYIEEHLVDSTGRRNSIPYSDFAQHIKKGSRLLEGTNRILQLTNTSSDEKSYRVELIHDSFCEPISGLKAKREKKKLLWHLFLAICIAAFSVVSVVYVVNINRRMKVNMSRVLASEANRLIDNHDSYLARMIALQALPPHLPYTPEAERALRKAVRHDDAILRGHTDWINSAAFSPNGELIVSASRDTTIRIWNAHTGEQIGEPLKLTDHIRSATYSPDGKLILSASYDHKIRIWNTETDNQIVLYGYDAAFDRDGKRIVSGCSDNTIRIWNAHTGEQIGEPLTGHSRIVTHVAFEREGKRIVSASDDKTIRIWDIETGKQIGDSLTGHTSWISSVAFSPYGERIVSASDDKTIRIWDAHTGEQIGEPLIGHTDRVNSAAFSPNGKLIVSASDDKTIRIWDAHTGEQIGELLTGHTRWISSVAFSPYGERIVSASNDKTIRIWDVQSGKQIWDAQTGKQSIDPIKLDGVCSAAFSPDGKLMVSASDDKNIRIWDAHTGKQVGDPLIGHTDRVNSAAFSPDGKLIVSTSEDCTIRIWNAHTGEQIGEPLTGHTNRVNSAAFSPNGKLIVSASDDNTICIWNVQKMEQIGAPLMGHTDRVNSAAFSPNGKLIVSTSDDYTIRIWDVQSGKQICDPLEGNKFKSAAFSPDPDGKLIVSADWIYIRIWDFPPLQQLIDQTNKRFKDRPLTPEERSKYYLD